MPLHNCQHTFQELSSRVLPVYMVRMRSAFKKTEPLQGFGTPRKGVMTMLRERGIASDFAGCYVLVDENKPIYVGISRGVIGRLRQHVFGKTHFDASLAFRIAMASHPKRPKKSLTRAKAMQDPLFGTSFAEAQKYLKTLQVAFVEIANPLELYVFEAYCAIELDTHQWNSFDTH